MSAIRLRGATSGTTDVVAAAIAGDGVLTLPSGTGTLATQAFVNTAVAAGGKVLQVVRATDGTQRTTTSTSYVDASISVTISPTSASSVIYVYWFANAAPETIDQQMQITDSSNTALSGAQGARAGLNSGGSYSYSPFSILGYSAPATTSATTYKARFRTTASTARILNDVATGQLLAIEVAP